MATTSFNLRVNISDKHFGTNITFVGKRIEIWKAESSYSELVGICYTDKYAIARFSLELTEIPSVTPPIIFLKIFEDNLLLPYTFTETSNLYKTLTAGDNTVTATVELDDNALSITNEQVLCNGVVTDNDGTPYSNLLAKISIKKDGELLRDLGLANTNSLGFFAYSFVKDKQLTAEIKYNLSLLTFDYEFYSANQLLGSYSNEFSAVKDFETITVIKVSLAIPSGIVSLSIAQMVAELGIVLPVLLSSYLATKNILTLRDIRSFGGLKRVTDLQNAEYDDAQDAIALLDAHAQLETLSSNLNLNTKVIQQGYTSVYKISAAKQTQFLEDLSVTGVNNFEATKLYKVAAAHSKMFTAVYSQRRMASLRSGGDTYIGEILELINDKCNCEDCEAALSPLAYLADLIWYAQNHLVKKSLPAPTIDYQDGAVVVDDIKALFCQSLCLTNDQCNAINEKICNYRLQIEILNCYKTDWLDDSNGDCQNLKFEQAERSYLLTAYFTLLEQLGTTYAELRSIYKSTDVEKRHAFTDKLGIINAYTTYGSDYTGPAITVPPLFEYANTIDFLYIDPNSTDITNDQLSVYLDVVFGLRKYRSSCEYVQSESLLSIWKKNFLNNLWISEDLNKDVYSLASFTTFNSKSKLVLDPDTVTADDFRFPNNSDSSRNKPYKVWENRKKFVSNVWSKILNGTDSHTPFGVQRGKRYFRIAGDNYTTLFIPGKKIIVYSADEKENGIILTVENSYADSTDTFVSVKENSPIIEKLYSSLKVDSFSSISIISYGPTTAHLELAGEPSGSILVGARIEIHGSAVNDGVYRVEEIISSTQIRIDKLLVDEGQTGDLFYAITHDIAEFTTEGNLLRVKQDASVSVVIDSESKFIRVEGSKKNDGTYSILTAAGYIPSETIPFYPNDWIQVELGNQLAANDGGGNITYLTNSYSLTNINPVKGDQIIFITDSNRIGAIFDNSRLEVERINASLPRVSVYQINDILSSGTGFKIDETLQRNEAGQIARLRYETISINDIGGGIYQITLPGDLRNILDADSLENRVSIDGRLFNVTNVSYSDPETTFEVHTDSALPSTATVKLQYPFAISAITAQSKFTIPAPTTVIGGETVFDQVLLNDIKASSWIVVNDNSNSNNLNIKDYTISAISDVYDDGGYFVDVFVNEALDNEDLISSGHIWYGTQSVQVINSIPNLPKIFTYFNAGNDGFGFDYEHWDSTITSHMPWSTVPEIEYFISKRDILLTSTDESLIQDTKLEIETQFYFSIDSFIAFTNLCEKYVQFTSGISTESLSLQEYTDLFNILVSVAKNNAKEEWYNEETSQSITLQYNMFWYSLTEPGEGAIDILPTYEQVLIDPQLIGLKNLPDMPAALTSSVNPVELWNNRNDELNTLFTTFKQINLQKGFEALINFSLGDYNGSGKSATSDFLQLSSALKSTNAQISAAAKKIIIEQLLITVDDYSLLYDVWKRVSVNGISAASADEYDKVYYILQGAYKRRVMYANWIFQENELFYPSEADMPPNTYPVRSIFKDWQTYKSKLPNWRTSVAERQEWQTMLAHHCRIPVVDPDILFPEDFVSFDSRAFYLWNYRKGQLQNEEGAINALLIGNTPETYKTVISGILEMDNVSYGFEVLADMEAAGIDITPRLKQIHLTYPEYKRINELISVDYYQSLVSEREELVNLLLQTKKRRLYYWGWNVAEAELPEYNNAVYLSPYFFEVKKPVYDSNSTDYEQKIELWRGNWKQRREWENKLKGRKEQLTAIDIAISNYVEDVENRVLPIIRNALVMFCGDELASLADNAKKLSNRFLVDFSINCCQHTTRIASAIDVMQKLIWTESLGIDKDIRISETVTLEFELDAPDFEDEWKWLGSYATWRSAMFVFLYPENLLLPTLKRYQSPAFIKLTNDIRNNNRLTPADACLAAKEYSTYFDDIATLQVEATCSTSVMMHGDSCINGSPIGLEDMFYAFALAPKTGNAYWQSKKYNGDTLGDYTFWAPINGLGGKVKKILGSSVYQQEDSIRHLYLFALVYVDMEGTKLVYIRYDLEKQNWESEYNELGLPTDIDLDNLVLMQTRVESAPPQLIYRGNDYRAVYLNKLDKKGKDWENDEWLQISAHHTSITKAVKLNAFIEFKSLPGESCIIATSVDNKLWYRILGWNDDGIWRNLTTVPVKFRGAYNLSDTEAEIQVVYNNSVNQLKQTVLKKGWTGRGGNTFYKRDYAHFYELEEWFTDVMGEGLSGLGLSAEHAQSARDITGNASPSNQVNYFSSNYYLAIRPFIVSDSDTHTIFGLYQLFQYLFLESNRSVEIRDQVNEINAWLCSDDFLHSKDNWLGRDFNWVNDFLTTGDYHAYFETDNVHSVSDKVTLKSLIDSFLERTVVSYYYHNHSHTNPIVSNYNTPLDPNLALGRIISFYVRNNDLLSEFNITNAQYLIDAEFAHNSGYVVNGVTAFRLLNSGNYAVTINSQVLAGGTGSNYLTISTFSYKYRLNPIVTGYTSITEEASSSDLALKKTAICATGFANSQQFDPAINFEYGREAWYFVPMFLGIKLSEKGYYKEALKWFKTVYDYTLDNELSRTIYDGTALDFGSGTGPRLEPDWNTWLLDPLNPHAIAQKRELSYRKYTVSTIAQTFIAYADALFTTDTVESVSQARELYEFAQGLLGLDIFKQRPEECNIQLVETPIKTICELSTGGFSEVISYAGPIKDVFASIGTHGNTSAQVEEYAGDVKNILLTNLGTGDFNFAENLTQAKQYIDALPIPASGTTISNVLANGNQRLGDIHDAVMSLPETELAGIGMKKNIEDGFTQALELITAKNAKQLKRASLNWLKEKRQPYSFNYEDTGNQQLMQQRQMSFSRPSSQAVYTLAYNMNPQAALDVVNNYPFPYVPNLLSVDNAFCVPPNPVYSWMMLSVEMNLFKIRNCLNIAGMKRDIDPYAAPTDTTTGLPQIGANGQLVLPGSTSIRPTIYRYEFLMERTKQLVSIAQQVESAYLAAFEKLDAETYNLLRAKQDLAMSKATVKLKDLQTRVAEDQVTLAQLQKERSEIQVNGLDEMINAGLNAFEQQMVELYQNISQFSNTIAGLDFGIGLAGNIAQAAAAMGDWGDLAGAAVKAAAWWANAAVYGVLGGIRLSQQTKLNNAQALVNTDSIWASQARREQEWNFQKTLATQDIKIGDQQIKVAQDGVRVAGQERNIADLQQRNAEDAVNFLSTKFTNADLYDWMTGVLGRVYSYFLQQATGTAKLAQNQLAFERQEAPSLIILDDYWQSPSDGMMQSPGTSVVDRRGLTGSARLLQDIYRLDQYAVETEKRKLQLTKTLSLSSAAPFDFQLFKETGELNFTTLMDYFNRDFPGHYLRLIKRVKVNVIALVPPTQGIKATLTSSGISRVVIGGSTFQEVTVRRSPEEIALTGSRESSGVFEMQMQDPKILNPFEGSGVCMNWQLKMPKASNLFDYNTIADVLFTIEYTALNDSTYERQVAKELDTDFVSDRAFSFRNEFSDAFYQLSHPEEFGVSLTGPVGGSNPVDIDVTRFDFPANVNYVTVKDLKFYVLTDKNDPDNNVFSTSGKSIAIQLFDPAFGQNSTPRLTATAGFNDKGIVSTLIGGGGGLSAFIGQSPLGKWRIDLPALARDFSEGKILDVIMIVTYRGELPPRI